MRSKKQNEHSTTRTTCVMFQFKNIFFQISDYTFKDNCFRLRRSVFGFQCPHGSHNRFQLKHVFSRVYAICYNRYLFLNFLRGDKTFPCTVNGVHHSTVPVIGNARAVCQNHMPGKEQFMTSDLTI